MTAITQALTTIRRSPYQALAAIIIVTVTFFMGYSFSVLGLFGAQVVKYAQSQQEIIAFFEDGVSEEVVIATQAQMQAKPYVKSVAVETQEQALQNYLQDNAGSPLLTELVTAQMLPASIAVSGVDIAALNQIYADLAAIDTIEDVSYQEQVTKTLESWIHSLELLGAILVGILAISSFLTIMVLTAMKATTQKYAISVMRLIGATKWYIKAPFIVEGMLYGLFGSVLGWSLMYLSLLYLTPGISEFQGEITLLPLSTEVLLLQVGIGVLAGLVLGGFAGMAAVNRLIRR